MPRAFPRPQQRSPGDVIEVKGASFSFAHFAFYAAIPPKTHLSPGYRPPCPRNRPAAKDARLL